MKKQNSIKSIANISAEMKRMLKETSPVTAEQWYTLNKAIARISYPVDVSIYDTTTEIQKLVVASAIASWAATSTTTPSILKKSTAREYSKRLKQIKEYYGITSRTKNL